MATSLFGPTPAELLMARQKEAQEMQMLRNQQIGQQGQQFGVFAPLYQAGLKFGDVGSQAAMQRMFPEQMDPRLQQATAVQSVLAKYVDEDQSDPAVLSKIGRELLPVAPEAGFKALTLAKELQGKQESPFAKIDPSKFTSNSLRTYAQTGDIGDLESIEKTASLKPNTDFLQIGQELGIPAKGSVADYSSNEAARINAEIKRRKEDVQRAGVPLENVYGKGVTETAVKRDQDIFDTAQKARAEITKIDQTLDLIESGNIVTGFGADLRLNVERFVAQFAGDPAAKAKVSNTQVLEALLGSDVFPLISALGIGARGLDTIPERQFLQKVFTGEISLDQKTLLRLTEIRRNVTQRAIDRYNERVNKGQLDRFFRYSGEEKETINIPRRSPSGIKEMSDADLLRLRQQEGPR
jgi:hypothetical protein